MYEKCLEGGWNAVSSLGTIARAVKCVYKIGVCVCVREGEREKEAEREREKGRERVKERERERERKRERGRESERGRKRERERAREQTLALIHIFEPTRQTESSHAVYCAKTKNEQTQIQITVDIRWVEAKLCPQ